MDRRGTSSLELVFAQLARKVACAAIVGSTVVGAIVALHATGAAAGDDHVRMSHDARVVRGDGQSGTPTVGAPHVLMLQVLLDRAGFSVGEIDGAMGAKTRKALAAFRAAFVTPETGSLPEDPSRDDRSGQSSERQERALTRASGGKPLDDATLRALGGERSPTTVYEVTAEDVAGPFVEAMPTDLMAKGRLEALAYTSVIERLAERFHASPALLRRLNRGKTFAQGDRLAVPDVEPMMLPPVSERRRAPSLESAARTGAVIVSRARNDLRVEDASGAVIFYAPVSSGSEHDPLPAGDWKVLDVYLLPPFRYNPDLFWDADPSHAKTLIRPGPNNPVGAVWIDIDREHYGLHGTPEPSAVGVTQSHGCVRLTNWDVLRLAALVQPGTPVMFRP